MLTVKDIKKKLDENNIKYNSYGDKEYYLGLLLDHGLVPGRKIATPEASIKLGYEPRPVADPVYESLKNDDLDYVGLKKVEPKYESLKKDDLDYIGLKKVESKYERLKTIKKNPRRVILEDFPSIYKAGKFIKHCPRTILNWKDRVWKNKYKIKVL